MIQFLSVLKLITNLKLKEQENNVTVSSILLINLSKSCATNKHNLVINDINFREELIKFLDEAGYNFIPWGHTASNENR